MPSPDKLFRLDPVETKVTAPVSQFQALAEVADRSVATRSLGRGLNAFSQALGGLAQFKKQEQIRDDIKIAKDAAVRGEVMPNVLPVAEEAYRNVIDINTASDSLLAIDRFENGDDFNGIVKHPDLESSQKTSQIEAIYDDYYARAAQSMQNPDTIQKLRLGINGLKEKAYQKVYETERNNRTIEGIHGLKSTLGSSKRFAEATGVPLTETLTSDWLHNNAKDLGVSHPYLDKDERTLLAFQTLATDEDVIGDPDIIENIMKSNYNKGFTFNNLLHGKGDDADEFRKIYAKYVSDSKAYFTKLEDDQKEAVVTNKDSYKTSLWEQYIGGGETSANGISATMMFSGQFTIAEANKYEKDMQKYMDNNLKAQRGSPEFMEVLGLIQQQAITLPSQVHGLVIEGKLNPELETELKSYLTEEGKQKLKFISSYQTQIKDLSKNVLSLSKLKLSSKGKDILGNLNGREPTTAEMMQVLNGSGLDPEQVNRIIQQVQDLHNGMNKLAEQFGSNDSKADTADGNVPEEHLQKFQALMEQNINQLIADIDKGLEPKPGNTEVNLPQAQWPVISTGEEFPLVVNQTDNIFDSVPSRTGAEIEPASGTFTFMDAGQSFLQSQNMTLRSYVLDATTKNWPIPFSSTMSALAEQEAKEKEAKEEELNARLTDTSIPLADRNVEAGNNLIRVGDFQITVDEFNEAADIVENNIYNPLVEFFNNMRVFSEDIEIPDRETPKILPEQEEKPEPSFAQEVLSTVNDVVGFGVDEAEGSQEPIKVDVNVPIKKKGSFLDVLSPEAKADVQRQQVGELPKPKLVPRRHLVSPKAKGEGIVKSTIDTVTKIFGDDKGFMKRIARHESLDGEHPDTFRKGYHGGLFQVDEIGFKDTQNVKSHPKLKSQFKLIKDVTGIDWTKVKWKDLRKPIHSAIAARLFLLNIPEALPEGKEAQAAYWKKYYNKTGRGSIQKFLESNKDN